MSTHIKPVYDRIDELTQRTTDLLETVLGIKRTIQAQVEHASESASAASDSATSTADNLLIVQQLKADLEALAVEARTLVNDAVAIVYGEGTSATATAGGIPVAGADGKIDQSWLPDDWDKLHSMFALVVSQTERSLQDYAELLKQKTDLAKLADTQDQRYQRYTTFVEQYRITLKGLEGHLASLQQTSNRHTQQISQLGMALAYQSEAEAMYRRSIGQSGLLRVRQYNYHGTDRRPNTENGQPSHMHNHPQYKGLLGSGEVQFVINGYLGQTRHRDYSMYTPQRVGSSYLATTYVDPPPQPGVLKTGTVEQQTQALRDLFQRYQSGEMPDGFGWTLTALECWFIPFADAIEDTYDGTFRHTQYVNNMNQALREGIQWTAGGARHLGENYAFEMPVCRILDEQGNPIVGILKHRMISVDVSSLGDLRPYLEQVHDPLRENGWNGDSNRWLIKENNNSAGMLDRMMSLLPGLDGAGAQLQERYPSSGYTIYDYFDPSQPLNAAYYSRFTRTLQRDASNQPVLLRGFNDSYLFAASNTRTEVLNTPINGVDYRFSWAIPMELVLRTPLEEWNPYGVPPANYSDLKAGQAGNGSQSAPYLGYHPSGYYYLTPPQLFSGQGFADVADTVGGGVFVKGADDNVYKCRESGHWVWLPPMSGVSRVQQRYAIFPDHQDGHKAMQTLMSIALERVGMLIDRTTDRFVLEKRFLEIEKRNAV